MLSYISCTYKCWQYVLCAMVCFYLSF